MNTKSSRYVAIKDHGLGFSMGLKAEPRDDDTNDKAENLPKKTPPQVMSSDSEGDFFSESD